jgi:hypothetical protein
LRNMLVSMTFGLLLLSATSAESQTLGIVGGINRSSIKGDAPEDIKYGKATRPTFGGLVEFRLTDDVQLHGELLYTQRGTRIGQKVEGQKEPEYDSELLLSYVSVPVLVRVISNSGRMYATSGVELAFLTSATLEQEGLPDTDVKDQLLSTDLAVNFGVGGRLHKGRPGVALELRYSQSILNLGDKVETEQSIPVRFRSSGFQLLASVFWTLGGDR